MASRVTSEDVARVAGVSRATVSYVLNGRSGQSISEATRERVLAAAQELGYSPSTAARTLRRGRSDLVLMLLPPEPLGRALAMVLDSASDYVEQAGLRLIAHRLPDGGAAAPLVRSLVPAALIVATPLNDEDLDSLQASGVPMASLQQDHADPLGADLGIGAMQVQYLSSAGHRRIGVALPAGPGYQWRADARLAAIEEACSRNGLLPPAVERIGLDPAAAAAAIDRWRQAGIPVTGVCAFDDEYAFALLAGLSMLNLSAPSDLAVVGAEDIPLARLAIPPLTTVSVHARRIGVLFAQLATASLVPTDSSAGLTAEPAESLPPVTLVLRSSA